MSRKTTTKHSNSATRRGFQTPACFKINWWGLLLLAGFIAGIFYSLVRAQESDTYRNHGRSVRGWVVNHTLAIDANVYNPNVAFVYQKPGDDDDMDNKKNHTALYTVKEWKDDSVEDHPVGEIVKVTYDRRNPTTRSPRLTTNVAEMQSAAFWVAPAVVCFACLLCTLCCCFYGRRSDDDDVLPQYHRDEQRQKEATARATARVTTRAAARAADQEAKRLDPIPVTSSYLSTTTEESAVSSDDGGPDDEGDVENGFIAEC